MLAVLAVLALLVVVCAVAGVVSTTRHSPGPMDRRTTKQATRSLRRGRLAAGEPQRAASVRLARSWAHGYWAALMLLGLAASQVLIATTSAGWLRWFSVVAAPFHYLPFLKRRSGRQSASAVVLPGG